LLTSVPSLWGSGCAPGAWTPKAKPPVMNSGVRRFSTVTRMRSVQRRIVAGSLGGWVDGLLMRITDGFLALPGPVLAIAVVAALGPSLTHTLVAVIIVWWPFYARLVRGDVARLAARPHVEAAKLAGVSTFRLAGRHLLPGAVPNALVAASLDIGTLILTLAALSFLGLGQSAPAPELGADSARNLSYFLQQWWIPVMPGLGVLVLALVGNVSGDCLRNLMKTR